ncbi:hypothetical protein MAR_003826, partial [Mya arenaria]
ANIMGTYWETVDMANKGNSGEVFWSAEKTIPMLVVWSSFGTRDGMPSDHSVFLHNYDIERRDIMANMHDATDINQPQADVIPANENELRYRDIVAQ